jgi:hypothetical protein
MGSLSRTSDAGANLVEHFCERWCRTAKLFATRPGRHVTAARGAITDPSPFAPDNARVYRCRVRAKA